MLEAALVDLRLGPDEGLGVAIIGFDEGIDVLPELLDRGEGRAAERLTFEDREPDLDLVEPRSAGRREVEADVGMAREPEISLGFMGAQVVEHDMNGLARIGGDDVVHEVEELDPPAPLLMCRSLDL